MFALRHADVQRRQQEIAQDDAQIQQVLNEFLARAQPPTWQEVVAEVLRNNRIAAHLRRRIAFAYYNRVVANPDAGVFHEEVIRILAPPPRIVRQHTLGALAADGQNVHTQYVTEQTRDLEAKLLSIPIPESQTTETNIAQEWLRLLSRTTPWGRILRTLNDVHKWFGQPDCRAVGDNLYRRILRGVVAKINRTETRDELYKRLWEECSEATGMCCEGHISRLCNVFVGFDEAFRPPVSLGELLQNKMAVIALSDLSDEEKRIQATAFFNEIGLPNGDRIAWIDAF